MVSTLLSGCAVSGGYWIPPSSPPTQAPFVPPLGGAQPVDPVQPVNPAQPTGTEQAEQEDPAEQEALAAQDPILLMTPGAYDPPLLMFTPDEGDDPLPPSQPETAAALPTMPTPTSTPEIYVVNTAPILYYAQAADTLRVVAVRFGVDKAEISSPEPINESGFINPGQLLIIPRHLTNTTASRLLIPDSEVVYSPSAVDFDSVDFANQAGGFLSTFKEWHKSTGNKLGAEIVERVALENSINPRLLMALLEYHSHWVYGRPETPNQSEYPLGRIDLKEKGLYNQLVWTVNQLSIGYYAYREGRLTEISFSDGAKTRLAPDINAGTAALQYYFAQLYDSATWLEALDPENGFPALYKLMHGDPWERARRVEPLYPTGISQPPLTLPFGRNWTWSYTGGPHGAWEHDGAYAALDFAPGSSESGCIEFERLGCGRFSGIGGANRTGIGGAGPGWGRSRTNWLGAGVPARCH